VSGFDVFLAIFSGTAVGILIGLFTEYYTSAGPILKIAEASQTGPATNIITGFAVGLECTVLAIIAIAAAILIAAKVAGGMALVSRPLACWRLRGYHVRRCLWADR
jgi:K(+)-stimulated pyrophosphate-energized sodium pump